MSASKDFFRFIVFAVVVTVIVLLFVLLVGMTLTYNKNFGVHWSAPDKNEYVVISGELETRKDSEGFAIAIKGKNISCLEKDCDWKTQTVDIGKQAKFYTFNNKIYGIEVENKIVIDPEVKADRQRIQRWIIVIGWVVTYLFNASGNSK